ncbi:hypothetical protein ACIQNU_42965 [Streptomyces sp. NPDC091292]|uniref:hypothetical protein n=1 Tax=Streptomyces sp. NPDC091292 TaxID=3365991 RepID=UPI0037FA796A
MSRFRTVHRIRAQRSRRKDYEPHTLIGILMEDAPDQSVHQSSVEVSFLGFRARSDGKTGFAALRALRREHPVLVHVLGTYLSVTWLLAAVIAAHTIRGR